MQSTDSKMPEKSSDINSDTISLEEIHNSKFDEKCLELEILNSKIQNEYSTIYNEKSGGKYLSALRGKSLILHHNVKREKT